MNNTMMSKVNAVAPVGFFTAAADESAEINEDFWKHQGKVYKKVTRGTSMPVISNADKNWTFIIGTGCIAGVSSFGILLTVLKVLGY